MAVRFVKGAWVSFPLFLIVAKLTLLIIKHSKTEDLQVKGMMMSFGWLGLAAVAWIATILGVNSVLWNSSQSIIISWFIFPTCSALALVVLLVWVTLLRALLPNEPKKPTTADPSTQEQSQ